MGSETKTPGKLIVLDRKVYDELSALKFEYCHISNSSKTYSEVVDYLIGNLKSYLEKIEAEKSE
jgi:hypothetical protein